MLIPEAVEAVEICTVLVRGSIAEDVAAVGLTLPAADVLANSEDGRVWLPSFDKEMTDVE